MPHNASPSLPAQTGRHPNGGHLNAASGPPEAIRCVDAADQRIGMLALKPKPKSAAGNRPGAGRRPPAGARRSRAAAGAERKSRAALPNDGDGAAIHGPGRATRARARPDSHCRANHRREPMRRPPSIRRKRRRSSDRRQRPTRFSTNGQTSRRPPAAGVRHPRWSGKQPPRRDHSTPAVKKDAPLLYVTIRSAKRNSAIL